MSSTEHPTERVIEVALANESPVVFPLAAPWTFSVNLSIILRRSNTPVTFSRRTFTASPTTAAADQKWSILDQEHDYVIDCPTLFLEHDSSLGIGKNDVTLNPDKPIELALFPFNSLDTSSYMPDLCKFDKGRAYVLRWNVSHLYSYAQTFGLATRLNRNKDIESITSENPPILFRSIGSWTFSFSEFAPSPWIEVHAMPTSSTLDLNNPDDFSVELTLTLRNSERSIAVPSQSSDGWESPTSLRQIGGWLTYINQETGSALKLRPPQMFVQLISQRRPPKNILWLLRSCHTLNPDVPFSVHQVLFKEARTEFSIAEEQFQEGSPYSVRLEHPEGITRWLEGTVISNLFWRIATGYWLSETSLEPGHIPFFQTESGSFSVVKS